MQIIIPEIKNDNNASISNSRLESDTSVDLDTNGRQPSPQAIKTEAEASQSAVSQCPMCGKSFGPRYILRFIVTFCSKRTQKSKYGITSVKEIAPHIICNLVLLLIIFFLTVLPCLMWTTIQPTVCLQQTMMCNGKNLSRRT